MKTTPPKHPRLYTERPEKLRHGDLLCWGDPNTRKGQEIYLVLKTQDANKGEEFVAVSFADTATKPFTAYIKATYNETQLSDLSVRRIGNIAGTLGKISKLFKEKYYAST